MLVQLVRIQKQHFYEKALSESTDQPYLFYLYLKYKSQVSVTEYKYKCQVLLTKCKYKYQVSFTKYKYPSPSKSISTKYIFLSTSTILLLAVLVLVLALVSGTYFCVRLYDRIRQCPAGTNFSRSFSVPIPFPAGMGIPIETSGMATRKWEWCQILTFLEIVLSYFFIHKNISMLQLFIFNSYSYSYTINRKITETASTKSGQVHSLLIKS